MIWRAMSRFRTHKKKEEIRSCTPVLKNTNPVYKYLTNLIYIYIPDAQIKGKLGNLEGIKDFKGANKEGNFYDTPYKCTGAPASNFFNLTIILWNRVIYQYLYFRNIIL